MQKNSSCELTVGGARKPTLRDLPEHYLQLDGFSKILNGDMKEKREGKRTLQVEADGGNPHAMMVLAWLHMTGDLSEGPSASTAADLIRKACNGNVDACYGHATNLRLGYGLPLPNLEEAVSYYKAALNSAHPRAAFWLGYMYEFGLGVPVDQGESERLYARGALEFDDPAAKTRWALLLLMLRENGQTNERARQAIALLQQAAAADHAQADYFLALLHMGTLRTTSGTTTLLNENLANKHLQKAANAGIMLAQYDYACVLLKGHETRQALPYLEAAADKHNHVPAMRALACVLKDGRGGVPVDKIRAERLERLARELETQKANEAQQSQQ